MNTPKNVEVNVQGNISGNLVIGNHNIVVNNPNGGVVNVVAPLPPAEPRTRPVSLRPRNFPGLLDRAPEMDVLTRAVESSASVSLFGESGIGKTSLLRKAVYQIKFNTYKDGVIYLSARDIARDDLLQSLYDSFFVSPSTHKPTDGELRAKLNEIHGLIFLDDVTLGREDVSALLDAMPQSLFVLSSFERVLWGEGQAISLDGLPEAEALQLFEQELGRAVTEDEKPVAQKICKVLLMHPLRILQIASMIREDGLSIPQAFQKLTTTRTQSPTAELLIQKASDTQKKILSLLAAAGGFFITQEHVKSLAASPSFDADVKSLVGRGFVQEAGSSLSLSSDAAAALMRLWNLSAWEDAIIQHFSNWLSTAPQDMLIDQASDLLFHLLKRTGEKKNWPQMVRLGPALERISILQKKWQRWVQILDLLRMAARALADKKLEGWVLHQLGTRSLCMGGKVDAETFLKQALEIRKAIGDQAGMQVTQHNLNILLGVPAVSKPVKPSVPKANNLVRWLLIGGVGGGLALFAIAALIVLALIVPSGRATPEPPTLTDLPTGLPVTFTPVIASPTVGSEPLVPTPIPTRTRTPSATPTPRPVILFDFVENAERAMFWEVLFDFVDGRSPEQLKFLREAPTPSPEAFASSNETAYVGWQSLPLMEDQTSADRLALLTYPYFSGRWIQGTYDLTSIELQEGDVFRARIGYKLLPSDVPPDSKYVTFAVYFYESGDSDRQQIGEFVEWYDGLVSEWEFTLPDDLAGRSGFFVLEVFSGNDDSTEWLVWLEAQLVGVPR